jgi:DNA-binding SARP family transcriptional activator
MASRFEVEAMRTPHLRIRLLGELDLRHDGVPVPPLGSARAESLLAFLVLHREAAQPRQRLAFLLWPDSSEPQARTNLRHLLHVLRRALPDADRFLEVTPRSLRWRDGAPSWVDVAAFEAAATRAERAAEPTEELAALREAAELYRGDLLESGYDEWLLEERDRLRRRWLAALERLVELLEAEGDHAQAIGFAERVLRADPLRERTYRLLMRLHDARGDRARALRVYHACAATLERELRVAPSAATRRAYEALLPRAGPAGRSRPPAGPAAPLGRPPLVGRGPQRARLTELWRAAQAGAGARLVLVTGEPGAGKTRLVEEFRSWCTAAGAATAEASSYPAEGALAYGPVVSWLRSGSLSGHLGRLDPARRVELARLLPELGPSGAGPPPPTPPDPDRRRLFEALAGAILAPAGPLLLVADDLHWADRETLQFLHYLLRARPQAPLLVVATARREELDRGHPAHDLVAGLRALDRVAEVEVGRLSEQETAALAERLARHPLGEAEAGRLFADTEGNPLFVVEALRAGWRGQDEPAPITPRVQAVIESRLAQLSGPARDLVGVAATIGREFTADALALAGEAGEEELVGALDELWRRRLVRDQGPDAYDFTHDRIREVAYLGLSPARRRHTHRRVARALERLHAGDPAAVAAQVAAHHERAGDAEAAVAWYQEAAAAAQRLPAYAEAVRLLERALALLETQAPGPARRERELAVLTRLQGPLGVVAGYGSERLAEVQRRGLALADELGGEPAAPLLRSLAMAALARGDVEEARRLGERLRAGGARPAGPAGDGQRALQGHYVLGIVAFWHGEFETARHHLEAALDRAHAESRPGHGPGTTEVLAASRLANTLGFLGRPEAAARARDLALDLATRTGHPHSRVGALMFSAMLALELRDPASVRAYTAELAARPGDLGRPTGVVADALAGYVEVLDGRPGAGIARIRRALEDPAEGEHAPGMHAMVARVLLEASLAAGDVEIALVAADRVIGDNDNVRTWESEGRRRRAELRAARGDAPAVEAGLREALAVARRQGARLFELRAAAGLLRRHLDAGNGPDADEARARLVAVLAGLPEGGDLPDLREAAALLGRG